MPKCKVEVEDCFGLHSVVTLLGGKQKTILELEKGDVLGSVLNPEKGTEFLGFLHLRQGDDTATPMKKIKFDVDGKETSLVVTRRHILYTDSESKVFSEDVKRLQIMNNHMEKIPTDVTDIVDVLTEGYAGLLTTDGSCIVNNVSCTCYSWEPEVVGFSLPSARLSYWLMHNGTARIRQKLLAEEDYDLIPSCNGDGSYIMRWADTIMKNKKLPVSYHENYWLVKAWNIILWIGSQFIES